jgi:Lactonase, 7-bladed beta-propeller
MEGSLVQDYMDNPNPEQQRRARRSSLQLPAAERRALRGRMRSIAVYLLIIAVGVNLFPPILSAQGLTNQRHVVFVMTNSAVRTLGLATCWNVVTPNAKFVYAVNSDTSNISGFNIATNGALTPIGSTLLASDPANSFSSDAAVSTDGTLLFNLNPGSATIGVFGIQSDGTLSTLTPIQIVPSSNTAVSGIAAS